MSFQLPSLYVNEQFSWGPPTEELTIDGQPFQLYFKDSHVGAVDWNSQFRDQLEEMKQQRTAPHRGVDFTTVEDDTRLRALDNERAKNKKPTFTKKKQNKFSRRRQDRPRRITELPSTIPIRSTTRIFAEFAQHDMSKLRLTRHPLVQELVQAGLPRVFDTNVDKATCNQPRLLDESNYDAAYFTRAGVSDDPVVRKLLRQARGRTVVVSDEVLSLLMTSNLTMHPWHVKVSRFQDILFLEKDEAANVDRQWVSETASREVAPSEDNMNPSIRISALGEESTRVHDCFVKTSCRPTLAKMKTESNPFRECQPRLYTYRSFTINASTPEEYTVIVRCEVDTVTAENKYMRLFGLLEQPTDETGSQWRKTMAKGGATELPRAFDMNRGKIGRWIALSNLCNATFIKIGFITRKAEEAKSYKDDAKGKKEDPALQKHEVLTVQTDTPQSLASQLGINVVNLWAIADALISSAYNAVTSGESAIITKPSGEGRIVLCEDEDSSDDDEEDEESDEDESDDNEDED